MKFEIMVSILFELLSKRKVKATYLAEKYEVSVRTIYRYISSLEMAGVPLYTTRGNNGGISIVDTYRFSSTFMTVAEFEQTINTLSAIEQSVPNAILNSAINKLKSTIKNEYSNLNLHSGNLIIDAGPWGDTVGYKSKLTIIQKGIDESKKLFIKYHDRNGEISERVVWPHIIVFKQGLWYCYAFCELRNEFRFFKTGRIEFAQLLNDKFNRQKISNNELPLNFWQNTTIAEDVLLEVNKNILSDVEEWLGIENISLVNGKHIASVTLPYDNGLVSKIMSYGSGIKVIEPKKLINEIKNTTKKIQKIYN